MLSNWVIEWVLGISLILIALILYFGVYRKMGVDKNARNLQGMQKSDEKFEDDNR